MNFKSWEFGKAAKTREGPVDLRSAKQVSKANRAEGALNLNQAKPALLRTLAKERGFALLRGKQAHLNKLCDAGGFKCSGCPTQPKTNF